MADGGRALLFADLDGTGGTLVDLGGYRGDWTAEMQTRGDWSRTFVFEPVAQYAERLRERFAVDERVVVCDFGLGAGTRAEAIRVVGDSSSIYRTEPGEAGTPVRIVDIADWWEESGIEGVAVLKVNIEGGEFEVLPRLIETGLIAHVERLLVQFHPVVPHASRRMRLIVRDLRRTHEPLWRYPFVWESWQRRR